ncbi:aldose 1-epimerase family protein [Flavobacterium macacae]|uniref:Aldose 1-epimerase family protein n=1 Tax=Flavobacterium macacae TaxID=2488993 RepID=A0A3P3W7D4_9FLAO|nr:aldose 1-epimerase family protein [Flavobacterium macacae]RRJ90227.1 aldose 1-epimerase family protein [Flavobacterium macacae]
MNFSISNGNLVAIINSKGAELNSLKKNNTEYIWEGNSEFWGKHAPILFPIVGTLKENKYSFESNEYSLSRHGFARDLEFQVYESNKESITFSLKSSEETFKNYPFQFELRVSYTLSETNLEVNYQVFNQNDFEMPFSIGGHPAFALPNNFENYCLKFDGDQIISSYFLKDDLLSDDFQEIILENDKLKLNYTLFKDDALIFKNLKSNSIEIVENDNPILKFTFDDFPNFGIWTKENAPFICLEPWFGYSDTIDASGKITEKQGITILESNKNFSASFSIQIY